MSLKRILVIAPHPDDEILGCGGTILYRRSEGVKVGVLYVTSTSEGLGWATEKTAQREKEISKVCDGLGVEAKYQLGLPTTRLDTLPLAEIIREIGRVIEEFQPNEVFVPCPCDAHSDHRVVFDATTACSKWFRHPFVRRVLAYETLSETEAGLNPNYAFQPNVFINITDFCAHKIKLLNEYRSEMGEFPFPRSDRAVKSLAELRGAQSGFECAEAFQLLVQRETGSIQN